MNKITPRKLRILDVSLPEGTECYLCTAIRNALANYREGREPDVFLDKDHAVPALAKRLGNGLKRYLTKDIRDALSLHEA